MKSLKLSTSVLILLVILTACGQQNAATVTPINLDVSVRAEPEPLAVGETTLIVTLKNANGVPVDGATLQIHGDMDHEGMMSIDREASESLNGEYRVPFEWTMGGGWIVTVTARLPNSDGEVSETFDFFVEAVSSESIINRNMATEEVTETPQSDPADVSITYQPDNDPAQAGDGAVTIILTDKDGNPIADAAVEVIGNMAHAGMMPITGKGEHTENGQYVVPLHWTMAGDWVVKVTLTLADGRQIEQTFNQQVVMP